MEDDRRGASGRVHAHERLHLMLIVLDDEASSAAQLRAAEASQTRATDASATAAAAAPTVVRGLSVVGGSRSSRSQSQVAAEQKTADDDDGGQSTARQIRGVAQHAELAAN